MKAILFSPRAIGNINPFLGFTERFYNKGILTYSYLTAALILLLNLNSFGQLGPSKYYDNVYVVDTVELFDPISVIYEHNDTDLELIIEKRYLNQISRGPKAVLKSDNIYISGGNYYSTTCEMMEATFVGKHTVQAFKSKPDYFLVMMVKVSDYIEINSSPENDLKYYFPKNTRRNYIKVLVAGCKSDIDGN